jgi:uncharacterized protein YkwD
MKFFLLISLMLIMFSACGKSNISSSSSGQSEALSFSDEFLDLVNHHRHDLGLEPLQIHESIRSAAESHSQAMATHQRDFGHSGLGARCRKIREEMGTGEICIELVDQGFVNARQIFDAWMALPEKRQKIEGDFTHSAIAMAVSDKRVHYWTQIFIGPDKGLGSSLEVKK